MEDPTKTFDHVFAPKISIHSTWFDNLSNDFDWFYRIKAM